MAALAMPEIPRTSCRTSASSPAIGIVDQERPRLAHVGVDVFDEGPFSDVPAMKVSQWASCQHPLRKERWCLRRPSIRRGSRSSRLGLVSKRLSCIHGVDTFDHNNRFYRSTQTPDTQRAGELRTVTLQVVKVDCRWMRQSGSPAQSAGRQVSIFKLACQKGAWGSHDYEWGRVHRSGRSSA